MFTAGVIVLHHTGI